MKNKPIPSNNEPREYFKYIDFTSEHENWGMRGNFMFHMSDVQTQIFVVHMMENDQFNLEIRPNFGFKGTRCITAECRTMINKEMAKAIKDMLDYANILHATITYKEGDFGYSITPSGRITKKWNLDDGAC